MNQSDPIQHAFYIAFQCGYVKGHADAHSLVNDKPDCDAAWAKFLEVEALL
jgi:hypothetical protein